MYLGNREVNKSLRKACGKNNRHFCPKVYTIVTKGQRSCICTCAGIIPGNVINLIYLLRYLHIKHKCMRILGEVVGKFRQPISSVIAVEHPDSWTVNRA